jgi:1,4-dihydroxy-2-naphthoyl-CoA synthase
MRYGLVNVPFTDLAEATQRWADKILAASPLAVQVAKHAVGGST